MRAGVPIGGTTDMVVALANGGAKMFNVSAIEASLLTPSGKLVAKLDRYEYGHSLGPREQRSFRYPLPISAEMPLGEYLLVASAYYNTRDKVQLTASDALDWRMHAFAPSPKPTLACPPLS